MSEANTQRRQQKLDKELEQYRSLMEVPDTFEDGFSWTSLAGAIFIALLMVPGAMYMQLLAGMGVGPAAQWVTVILFIEVARRAHQKLRRPEIFILFYMAGALMAAGQIGQGPVRLLYQQFFAQSKAASGLGIADKLPVWFAPNDPEVLAQRDFFDPIWYPALFLLIFQTVVGQINTTILGYGLFRLASDIEKLPFPMAPIGAQGLMALAEQQTEEGPKKDVKEGWRWRIFSIGAVIGLAFGGGVPVPANRHGGAVRQTDQHLPHPVQRLDGQDGQAGARRRRDGPELEPRAVSSSVWSCRSSRWSARSSG